MAIRIYVMPIVENVFNGSIFRTPKYIGLNFHGQQIATALPGLEALFPAVIDYGFQNVCIYIADVTPAQHTLLSAQTDVLSVPANIDNNLTTGAVNATKTFLESINIPNGWINTSFTYRRVLRLIGWLFQFMQRLHGIYPHKLFDGITALDTTYGSLSPEWQAALLQAGQSFGFNTSGLTSSTTLRTILKFMADQFNDQPLNIGLIIL